MKRKRHYSIEIPLDIPLTPAEVKRFRYALRAACHNAIGTEPLALAGMGFRWQTKRRSKVQIGHEWLHLFWLLEAEKLVTGEPSAILESTLHEAPKGHLELHMRTEG